MIFECGLTALFAFSKGVFSQTLKQVICISIPFTILMSTYTVQGDTSTFDPRTEVQIHCQ